MAAPFTEVSRLAQGEIAEVILATLPNAPNATFIVKRLRGDLTGGSELAGIFRREIGIAARLVHPNIVRVVEVGEHEGAPWFAMEHLDGQTLLDVTTTLVRRRKRMHPGVACGIAARIARALVYAHAATIVHRDVSPDNVMLTRDGETKLLDFGIARVLGTLPLTRSGLVRGKVAYAAPEVLAGLEAGPPSDLFSLGVVLWQLLVGRHPFAERGAVETMRAIREDPASAPSTHASRVTPRLDALTLAMLAKFPLGRPTAAIVASELDAASTAFGVRSVEHEVATLVQNDP
jgi:serine/threonine protein kinase